ncbi:hypothetical protein M2459_000728 [Parabacteroides sp. PF5-5]|jgi:Domain of unknown function (DUF1858).|uniref:DUF1858 domain-containing protein n=1 Tax=Bacteroidales TaxID=171549 RepID=UPI0003636918|nr:MULTISPECIES: DUF1858 domain-containing protein [Bacteroidales]EOA56140.1 hypothetical protein HMPREF1214_03368 [Bacteroides sp. HPS0048]KKB53075.1 hypothetical protein HMPREF1212_01238 [Parabacteroides sp. HGS0025]MDH6304001.1 hypothetical protein [Parabacteroides sp. PH5-39]MDH6315284.1 hypothetical protein [Parabacteroides sp. PF5-13]MDH6318944.1 hypothetical protein [Parabacteroides sp. PH5-13]
MEIDLQTKIADLLKFYPDLEDTLLELSPAFAKLRNPILRRTVAKVTSIQQAAKIAGISPSVMVQTLRKAAGLATVDSIETYENNQQEPMPEWFDETKITTRFDASPIINAGESPMQEILRLSKELQEGVIMELTAPFRPEPIIDILKSKGFKAWSNGGKSYFMK